MHRPADSTTHDGTVPVARSHTHSSGWDEPVSGYGDTSGGQWPVEGIVITGWSQSSSGYDGGCRV